MWRADALLAHRDPALPGLATLLNPAALLEDLRTLLAATPAASAQVLSGTPYYVRYKVGTNCLVAYQLHTTAGPLYLHGMALTLDNAAKAHKQLERAQASALGPGGFFLAERGLLLTFFPNDRRLKSLARLAHAEQRHELWQRLTPDQPTLTTATLTPLRYKPERRFVARLAGATEGADTGAYLLRLYTPDAYATALANQRAFVGNEQVRIAQVIGRSKRRGTLLLEWLPGQPLDTLLRQPVEQLSTAFHSTGQALAVLHAQRPSLAVHYTPEVEVAALSAAVGAIAELLPACAERMQRLHECLRPLLAEQITPCCAIHGDFSADQVLWQRVPTKSIASYPPVAILDLDRAGYGTPAADLGSFLAHLHQLEIRRQLSAVQRQVIGSQLLAGYQHHTATMPTREEIRVQTAVRLLRLAPDAFRQRWSADWPRYTQAVIARVEALLNQRGEIV